MTTELIQAKKDSRLALRAYLRAENAYNRATERRKQTWEKLLDTQMVCSQIEERINAF